MNIWIIWGLVIIAQNFSFTFVSRARNSASLKRHVVASLLSNGIWFASQGIMVNDIFAMMKGAQGWHLAVASGLFYTVLTMAGSIAAHKMALMTEKGKAAVGASAQYAQIKKADWERVLRILNTTEAPA